MEGALYICATPIGNLEDITLRVLNTLKEVDLIAAEDTRHSLRLLRHYDIKTPLTSYHKFNKISKGPALILKLKEGNNIALITDAGTPAISDPGEDLVRLAYENGIRVYSLPGPTACITALTLSGLKTRRFSFEAFLPSDNKQRLRVLEELKNESRTIILYEAPHRLLKTLNQLHEYLGDRKITILRELTKKFEEVNQTSLKEAIDKYKKEEAKGEIVLVIEGKSWEELDDESQAAWSSLSIKEHMEFYENQGIDRKEAMKKVAKDRGVSKRDIYNELLDYK
ncbi:MAG: 16S rRNA (cytidine(1402)-2'-O)-methyltransferase [Clostridiales bacterium]|nr:16S rRNA (cytidine(1402)-2'-O)-methyltransferase [Clostridiales bacterium]